LLGRGTIVPLRRDITRSSSDLSSGTFSGRSSGITGLSGRRQDVPTAQSEVLLELHAKGLYPSMFASAPDTGGKCQVQCPTLYKSDLER
jgi:hypothetical protein